MKNFFIFVSIHLTSILCQSIRKTHEISLPNNNNVTTPQPPLPNPNDTTNEHSFSKFNIQLHSILLF